MELRTIDLVHSTFCRQPHTHKVEDLMQPRSPEVCYYYLEGQVEHGENMDDHKLWDSKTESIADRLSFTSDDRMVRFIQRLGEVASKASILEFEYPGSKEILKESLFPPLVRGKEF